MLHLFIERTGLIVLMILHQPSDEILEAMDSITIMMEGQIAFHQEDMMHFNPEVGQAQFVHRMLRDGSSNLTDSSTISCHSVPRSLSIVQPSVVKSSRRMDLRDNVNIEQQDGLESSNPTRVSVSEYLDRVHYHTLYLRQSSLESAPRALRATISSRSEDVVSNVTSFFKQLSSAIAKDFTLLWQVQPLLRRMQLHRGTPWVDFGSIAVIVVIAGWSQYASSGFGVSGKLSGKG